MHTNERERRAKTSHQLKAGAELNNEVAALAVVCSLVLEPLSVSLHATNLLAIVVGNGVCNRIGGRVDTESLDAVKEFLFFL